MAEERLEEIRGSRIKKRRELIEMGKPPYPAECRRTHNIGEVLSKFDELTADSTPIILVGRTMAVRRHGGLFFIDLTDAYGRMQVQLSQDGLAGDTWEVAQRIDTGDFLQVLGKLTVSRRSEKTLKVQELQIISKSIRPIPTSWHGLKDQETRYRQRAVDLILNEDTRRIALLRSKAIDWLRQSLRKEGWLEVETPILQPVAGGAAAQPFVTHHNALDLDLYLRIAPELYLKRLLVGGLEKIFEIGRNFRNEGIDRDHNPEFTMCELYWAYADYEDLMEWSEQLITKMVSALTNKDELIFRGEKILFKVPWKRIRYVEALSDALGFDILENKDIGLYEQALVERKLDIPEVMTYAKLVEELYKELVKPKILQPTLVYDYPKELVPLAKVKAQDARIAEMVQVLIGGVEVIKAYTELNDPIEQRQRFADQVRARAQGDAEAAEMDEAYLQAMEYGMPPAAGWGLGVDRMVAIMADAPSIRDTVLFPLMKPEQ